MRSWAIKRALAAVLAAACLPLCGCARMLERSYTVVEPHSAVYRESGESGTLRADTYQDLVNALLLLLGEHAESGVVRLYNAGDDAPQLCDDACREVQRETALGSYLLDYVTYSTRAERAYFELSVVFGYRRTAEQQEAIVNTTGVYSLPALLREAAAAGDDRLCLHVSYFTGGRSGVEEMVAAVQSESEPEAELPWRVVFYPDVEEPEIVEIRLRYDPAEFPAPEEPEGDEMPAEGEAPVDEGEEPGEVPAGGGEASDAAA